MRRWTILCVSFLAISMMGSDTCKVAVNVKTPPVAFATDGNGVKGGDITVKPGDDFVLGIPYQDGKGPYTCTLANAPAWMVVNSTTPGYCTITGTVPACPVSGTCDGTFGGDLTVTDSAGAVARLSLGPPRTDGL